MPFLQFGTEDQTEYFIINSGVEGNTFFLVGGVHGDEQAGYEAVEDALGFDLQRGKMFVFPKLCIDNINNTRRKYPIGHNQYVVMDDPDDSGDPNRYFPRPTDEGYSSIYAHSPLIIEFWELVLQENPLWVLDCHEAGEYHFFSADNLGNTIVQYGNKSIGVEIVNLINAGITEEYKLFERIYGGTSGGLSRAVGETWDSIVNENKVSFTIETASNTSQPGIPDPSLEEQIKYHLQIIRWSLYKANLIDISPRVTIISIAEDSGNINIEYKAAGGLSPFEYIVEYKTDSDWTELYSGENTTATLIGADTNKIYFFRIKARSNETDIFGTEYGNYCAVQDFELE